jgi:hypothetical protein
MTRSMQYSSDLAVLEELIAKITVDAYNDDEQLWAFRQALADNLTLPCDGSVIGEPLSVIGFDYDGNERRGLTAKCHREDGSEHVVAACEVVLPPRTRGAQYLGAYRKWLGLEPFPPEVAADHRSEQSQTTSADLDLGAPLELVAVSVKGTAARCRLPGSDRVVTLRASRLWDVVPGEIVVVKPRKQWNFAGHSYLSGDRVHAARRGGVGSRASATGGPRNLEPCGPLLGRGRRAAR